MIDFNKLSRIVGNENRCRYYSVSDGCCYAPSAFGSFGVMDVSVQDGEYVWSVFKTMSMMRERGSTDIYDTCPFYGEPNNVTDEDGNNRHCRYYKP